MKIFTLASLLFLLLACGNAEQDAADLAAEQARAAKEQAAYQSMMDGHDRIMPMMGQITQAQRTITEQLTQGGHGEDYRDLLLAANEQLEDANDGMMNWMNKIVPLDELRAEQDEEEVMETIKNQTRAISDVETDVKTSLANAEQVLGTNHDHAPGTEHDHN